MADYAFGSIRPTGYTFDPVSQRSPLISHPVREASRERGSRTTARAARATARWTAGFWLLVYRAGKRGEANAVQEISTGR